MIHVHTRWGCDDIETKEAEQMRATLSLHVHSSTLEFERMPRYRCHLGAIMNFGSTVGSFHEAPRYKVAR